VTHGLPQSDDTLRDEPVTWIVRGIKKHRLPWVDPAVSLQWRYFQRAVATLQARGNRVFVLVGPFNEHALTERSRQDYQKVKQALEAWLQERGIAHLMPSVLPSEMYADDSHPLSAGYQRLARQLLENDWFR